MKIRWWFLVPVVFLLATVLLFRFVLFIGYVPTESMEPALPKGSIIVGSRIFDDLKVGDVIVFRHDGKLMVKRIAAVFGDEVIHKGLMIQVPRGRLYVLGDNKEDSLDSRCWGNPFVEERDVIAVSALEKEIQVRERESSFDLCKNDSH